MALPGLGCGGLFSYCQPYRGCERNGCRESDELERCGCRESDELERCGCRESDERERCGCRESDERERCGSFGYCSICKLLYFLMQVGGRWAVGANLPFFEENTLGGLGIRFALCLAPSSGRSLLLAEVCAPSVLFHPRADLYPLPKSVRPLPCSTPGQISTPCRSLCALCLTP